MPSAQQQFYYKSNRLQQLRGFCFAAQFGNISRAAEHLGLTQPSISLQIKALEDELGCKVFIRRGSRIELTADGERLLLMARPLVDGIQGIYDEFHQEGKAKISSELRIAANSTVKTYLLPRIVDEFLKNNPGIRIILRAAEHEEAIESLQADNVDMIFLPRRHHLAIPKYCEYIPVFHFVPSLITRKDHPLAGRKNLKISDIASYSLVLPDPELSVIEGVHEKFNGLDFVDNQRLRFRGFETGREYIESGHIITISSDVWVRKPDILVATPLNHLFPPVDYGIMRKRNNKAGNLAKTEKFIETSLLSATQHPRVES